MYILVMMLDDFDNDIFIDLSCFSTLSDAVAEGKRRCVDKDYHFQIWKQTAGRSEMVKDSKEEYNND